MTIVVNFYAGPSAGKTIAAIDLCSELKKRGFYAELVTEVAKDEVLSGRRFNRFDQFYLFGAQSRCETELYGRVDIIVTDSPVPLNAAYGWNMSDDGYAETFLMMAKSHLAAQDREKIRRVDIWLQRMSHFQKEGRIHNQEESIEMDEKIREFLGECDILTVDFFAGKSSASEIADFVIGRL
jgi:RecA/RadA recombinase